MHYQVALNTDFMLSDYVLGVGLFDLKGFLIRYLTIGTEVSPDWAAVVFNALSLQALLGCVFQAQTCERCIIRGTDYHLVIGRQAMQYAVLLLKPSVSEEQIAAIELPELFVKRKEPQRQAARG